MTDWQPDALPGWQARTLDLGADEDGPVMATLVRREPRAADPSTAHPKTAQVPHAGGPAVLYVHGYNDYFFQTHLAEAFEGHGYTFYALDLRRCGRSIRPWTTPHYCTDLREYAEDLTVAARILRDELGHDRLVVHAHSTGGLTASLWAHSVRGTDLLDALVLNSPWFDLNAHWFDRVVSTRVLDALGPLDPHRVIGGGPSAYSRSLHVSNGGEWDYDLALKPPEGFPPRAGWMRAVRRGHARLSRGLDVRVPVLVCSASRSGPNREDNPDLRCSDTVLDVRQIAYRAPLLGADVTYEPVEGAVHDLALSAPGPRATYLALVLDWLDARSREWRTPLTSTSMDRTTTRGASMPDLQTLTWRHLEAAQQAPNGRSAERVVHDGELRQTVLALAAGQELGEHNAPHAATIQVLHGLVRVTSSSGDDDVVLPTGSLHQITHERHGVTAVEDSVFLLTTVTGIDETVEEREARTS